MNETCCSQEQKFTNEDKIICLYHKPVMRNDMLCIPQSLQKWELSSNLHTV